MYIQFILVIPSNQSKPFDFFNYKQDGFEICFPFYKWRKLFKNESPVVIAF
jgi:hypothetical protein